MLQFVTKNKKIILISLISILALFLIGSQVLAVTLDVGIEYGAQTGLGTEDIRVTVAKLIRAAFGLLGILAVAIVVYAGFVYMTSGGVPEKIDTAKKTLIAAAIGLVIMLSAYAIASFVINALLEATGVAGEPCGECVTGDTQACAADGAGCTYIERCDNTCWTGCQKTDPNCPYSYPFSQCPNPAALGDSDYSDPWLCLDPAVGGRLQYITVLGGNMTENPGSKRIYFKDSSGNEFDVDVILSCADNDWFEPLANSDLMRMVIEAPAGLILDGNFYNDYRVIVEFDGNSSENKIWFGTDPQDIYRLDSETDSTAPGLVCILDGPDPFTASQSYISRAGMDRWVKFARFDPAADIVTYNNSTATKGTATVDIVQTTVPLTTSGNVVLNNAGGDPSGDSNPMWFDITCDQATANTDCLSGCCIPGGAQFFCSGEDDCLGGVNEECFGGCFDAGCQTGLFCDTDESPCTCQARGLGAPCDGDDIAPLCQADDNLCGDPQDLYCSDTAGCICQNLPKIDNVIHPDGAVGNITTIFGRGFGADANANTKVYFVDLSEPPVEIEAWAPQSCSGGDYWDDNQVIISVPNIIQGDYIIKLINTDSLEATWQYFEVNEIERPGLCQISPRFGAYTTKVSLNGRNFGTLAAFNADPDSYSVQIGGVEFDNKVNWIWGDFIIGTYTDSKPTVPLIELPNNQEAQFNVQVKSGEEYSNPISFTYFASEDLPFIDYIDPVFGPPGQYVTIVGENFGTIAGRVKFYNGESFKENWSDGVIPPSQCSDYWQDDRVIIKVPTGLNTDDPSAITLQRDDNIWAGNQIVFDACANNPSSCPLLPGICGIVPDQAPINTGGIQIFGEYFGLYDPDDSKVTFYTADVMDDLAAKWSDINISPLTVPIGAKTGPVRVVRGQDGVVSNGYPFIVGDCREDRDICTSPEICCEDDGICQLPETCEATGVAVQECTYGWSFSTGTLSDQLGPPQVLQDILCVEETQSPSPWMESESNCVNALVSARFNQAVNSLTLVDENIVLQPCNIEDPADPGFKQIDCSSAIPSTNIDYIPDDDNNAVGFIFYPDTVGGLLEADRWYQVTLESGQTGIRSQQGIWLDGDYDNRPGGNFSWNFKIADATEECTIAKVLVAPQNATLDIEGDYQDYMSMAMAENCNILNGTTYDWDWYKVYSDGSIEDGLADNIRGTAFISEDDDDPADGNTDYKQVATPNAPNQGLVYVAAEAEDKKDEDNKLIVDLNTPVIDYIYPDNGLFHPDVNSYVTVYGYNFGDSPEDSQILFDKVPAQLADCPNAWTDTIIQVVVPKGEQVEIEQTPRFYPELISIAEGAQLFYDFEEESKIVAQDIFNQNDAEIIDGFKENERFGKAVYLNGSSSFVNILNSQSFAYDEGSIEFWFKSYEFEAGNWQTLFSFSDNSADNIFSIEISPPFDPPYENEAKILIKENIAGSEVINNITTIGVVKENTWHHLVYTYDGEKYILYIDGRKFYYVTNGDLSQSNTSATGFLGDFTYTNILLGAGNTGSAVGHFNGVLDNVILYDRALTEDDVWRRLGLNKGQVLVLNFDESGGKIIDSSINAFTDISVVDPSTSFITDTGVSGRALNLNNDNSININDHPALVFTDEVTIESWIKIPQSWFDDPNLAKVNKIYSSNRVNFGIMDCDAPADGISGLCFQVYLADEDAETGSVFYNEVSLSELTADQWNYVAATYDGQAITVYLNGNKHEFTHANITDRRIMQKSGFGDISIGNNEFIGAIDQFAVYTSALSEEVINSRTGANDGSHVVVKTPFGEAVSEESFNYSNNVYPFLCSLTPFYGVNGTQVSAYGDNFGESDITTYQGKQYGVGSYFNLDLTDQIKILAQEVNSWVNNYIDYFNPIGINDFAVGTGEPKFDVYVTIDPLSDPYNDIDNDGDYTDCDPFDPNAQPGVDCDDYADPEFDGYDLGEYIVDRVCDNDPTISCQSDTDCVGNCVDVMSPNLASNTLPFYLPPYIFQLSPDKGPIEQWVTIIGQNFGDEAGKVYFYNGQEAVLAPCNINWTNDYIIAVVPSGAESGDLYVETANGIESANRVSFEVNNSPLGAGLCEVYNLQPYLDNKEAIDLGDAEFVKENIGNGLDYVQADGDRFGEEQLDSTLLFTPNVPTLIGMPIELEPAEPWSDQIVIGQINPGAQTGLVTVVKKVEIGRQCIGFSIGDWCPGGEEIAYEDVPSNGYPFNISQICDAGRINFWNSRDEGFPMEFWVYDAAGEKQIYEKINAGRSTTDGTYLYTLADRYTDYQGKEDGISNGNYTVKFADHDAADPSSDSYGIPDEDNARTIWKIGTGYNGTELGRVYAKYQFDYRYNTPDDFKINPSQYVGFGYGYFNIIGTSDGSLYAPEVHFHPNTNINPTKWRVTKIRFNNDDVFDETEHIYHGTWSTDWVSIPQGIVSWNDGNLPEKWEADRAGAAIYGGMISASNGEQIFTLAYDSEEEPYNDYKEYTIQILGPDWKELRRIYVKPAIHSTVSAAYLIRSGSILLADKQYLYRRWADRWSVIDWRTSEWVDYFGGCTNYTKEHSGHYDWYNNKYWFGNWTSVPGEVTSVNVNPAYWHYNCVPDPAEAGKFNKLYRYSACEIGAGEFCRSDEDCKRGALACDSKCIDGICTPWIKEFTPTEGAIGTWTTLNGCWFGCDPGQIYFNGTKANVSNPPIGGALARYYFETGAEDSNGKYNGSLVNDAFVENGELVLDGANAGMDLNNSGLHNPDLYGGKDHGKVTLAAWIYPTVEPTAGIHQTLFRRIGGFHYITINPTYRTLQGMFKYETAAGVYANTYLSSKTQIPINEWTHIAVTLEAGQLWRVYINGVADNGRRDDRWIIHNYGIDSGVGLNLGGNASFPGRMDDVYIYNRALATHEVAKLAGSKAGIPLTDPECGTTWDCSSDGYDQVIIEVPDKNILPNEENSDPDHDATDGRISLVTARGQTTSTSLLTPSIFDVTDDPIGPQICNLIPDSGKRGDTIRIHGENLGDPVLGDYVYFGFGDLYEPQEPWFDPIDEVYELGEDFVDFDEDTNWDGLATDLNYPGDLVADNYNFNIDSFYADPGCPAGGWDESDICFKVPHEDVGPPSVNSQNSDAGGQGTFTGQALDNVKLFKDLQEYGSLTFNTLFGFCGDDLQDLDTGEQCDGEDMQLTEADRQSACLALFPGECLNGTYDNQIDCEDHGHTWDVDTCLYNIYPDQATCDANNQIWQANDTQDVIDNCQPVCDSGCELQFCYNGICLYLDSLCGNGTMDSFPSVPYEEDCDCGGQLLQCALAGEECPAPAQGNVSCASCSYDYSDCQVGLPDPLVVTGHIPYHGEEAFCRNGIIDIYFDQVVNPGTIGYVDDGDNIVRNIPLWKCNHPAIVQSEKKGLVRGVLDYFKNIFRKLVGADNKAYAEFTCATADWELVPFEDYSYDYVNINNKTKVSVIHNGHLDPATEYAIEIIGTSEGVRSSLGGILDNDNSPIAEGDLGLDVGDYGFLFKTLGELDPVSGQLDQQSGVCDVEWIDTLVYRQEYTSAALANRPSQFRTDDLFVCAGKDDCELEIDYDQDSLGSGNQHIYKAIGKHSSGFSLKATYQWSKNDVLDPYRVLEIYNDFQYCDQGDSALINQECQDSADCETSGQCGSICIDGDLAKLGDVCTDNSDCGLNGDCDIGNEQCVSGDTAKIGNSCTSALDCETGGACVSKNICIAGDTIGTSCDLDADCGADGVCTLIGDIAEDPNQVKNDTGEVIVTALPIKEAVAQLVVEAQADGSFAAPAQETMTVYILLCSNPWPSFEEKFPISSLINAYNFELYYCRDAGVPDETSDDLPAATWLFPEVTSLSVLNNTDFEFGDLRDWVVLSGNAFNDQPVFSDITRTRDGIPSLIQGSWWLNSQENYRGYDWQDVMSAGPGGATIGVLQSQAFLIEGDLLKFRIAGGNNAWPGGVTQVLTLGDALIDNVTAVVLAIKDDPSPAVAFEVVADATGDDVITLAEKEFTTSDYMTGRSCTEDADCNGWGTCKDLENSLCGDLPGEECQCSPVTGIIYVYDNNISDYISFDDLRQFKQSSEIPIRF
ncbi:LamG-like jellyroll fold domain-containing protein [Patescibacteria group bacterium]